jgi:hypothetical protein
MAPSALPFIAIAALALGACDLSQTKPQTEAALPVRAGATQSIPDALEAARAAVQGPASSRGSATGVESGAGERSIRLYGPGVSRKRQIHV